MRACRQERRTDPAPILPVGDPEGEPPAGCWDPAHKTAPAENSADRARTDSILFRRRDSPRSNRAAQNHSPRLLLAIAPGVCLAQPSANLRARKFLAGCYSIPSTGRLFEHPSDLASVPPAIQDEKSR